MSSVVDQRYILASRTLILMPLAYYSGRAALEHANVMPILAFGIVAYLMS